MPNYNIADINGLVIGMIAMDDGYEIESIAPPPPPPPPPPTGGGIECAVYTPTPGSIMYLAQVVTETEKTLVPLSPHDIQTGDIVDIYFRAKNVQQPERAFELYRSGDPNDITRWDMQQEIGTDVGDLNVQDDHVRIYVTGDPDATLWAKWSGVPTDNAIIWIKARYRGFSLVELDLN